MSSNQQFANAQWGFQNGKSNITALLATTYDCFQMLDSFYHQPFAPTSSFFYSFVPHTISAWNALQGYVTNMSTSSTF